ncbi:hypothetical protein CgunFtcFv8_027200 [Champsocephalus gunnari]|uniref:Uncharacterized protein n=1 Tax=Champsocephalus gunnari TaxID=52237 RepID=A0AAN8HX33_CHAGU|nr:hypothetical protein CgunFtcFv8_027200 [Champsocephalus gunnari]
MRITPYPADAHRPQLNSGFPLTVKDLLLSGTPEPVSEKVCPNEVGVYRYMESTEELGGRAMVSHGCL